MTYSLFLDDGFSLKKETLLKLKEKLVYLGVDYGTLKRLLNRFDQPEK